MAGAGSAESCSIVCATVVSIIMKLALVTVAFVISLTFSEPQGENIYDDYYGHEPRDGQKDGDIVTAGTEEVYLQGSNLLLESRLNHAVSYISDSTEWVTERGNSSSTADYADSVVVKRRENLRNKESNDEVKKSDFGTVLMLMGALVIILSGGCVFLLMCGMRKWCMKKCCNEGTDNSIPERRNVIHNQNFNLAAATNTDQRLGSLELGLLGERDTSERLSMRIARLEGLKGISDSSSSISTNRMSRVKSLSTFSPTQRRIQVRDDLDRKAKDIETFATVSPNNLRTPNSLRKIRVVEDLSVSSMEGMQIKEPRRVSTYLRSRVDDYQHDGVQMLSDAEEM